MTTPAPRAHRSDAVESTEPAVEVRVADASHLDVIVALRLALLREERRSPLFARPRRDAAELARTLSAQQLAMPTEVTLLAWDGARAVGLLRCTISRGTRLVRPTRYGFLTSAYVLPSHRRRGVLRALLDAAEQWCRARGLREVRLHCTVENAEGQDVWERLGYRPSEVVRRRVLSEG